MKVVLVKRRWSLIVVLMWGLMTSSGVRAQPASPEPDPEANRPVVSSVHFKGNDVFSDETLAAKVHTTTNRRFLGIPGLTWWRWVYQLGQANMLGDRVSQALMRSGEAPAFLVEDVLASDVERLRAFYQQEGFREAQVAAQVDTLEDGEQVVVTFRIRPGPPTYVRRVRYEGGERLSRAQRRQMVEGSLLEKQGEVEELSPPQFTARHQRYSEPLLHEERRRLLSFLREEGFAAATRDSIRVLVFPHRAPEDELHADSFDVTFRLRPGMRYRFGDVHMEVVGPEERAPVRRDTITYPEAAGNGTVSVRVEDESKLETDLLRRSLQFRPGQWYAQSDLQSTKRRLEATGVFSFTDIIPLPHDTTRSLQEAPRQAYHIELRTRPRHQLRVETFMLQRSGVLGAADSELGTGVGLTYENVNIFGEGETFRLRNTASIAADTDLQFFTSAQAEGTASLTFPYLVTPFHWADDALELYDARTQLSLSLLSARRDALNLVIRGRGKARLRLTMQHTATLTSLVDLMDLSLSNPDTLEGFKAQFLDPIFRALDDPVQEARISEDYTRPQINNALRYTLRLAEVNPLRRERGYSYEGAAELGGHLPYLLDRFSFSPGELEGSLPGLPIFRRDGSVSRLLYRRYLRGVADLRRYHPLGRYTVLAWKVIGGWAHPLGSSRVVPFDRRFYSGGASSVRGWRLRELGPGTVHFASDSLARRIDEGNLLGGEVKLELSLELRHTMLERALAARWIGVLFIDAGNVWLGPRNPGFESSRALPAFNRRPAEAGRFNLGSFYRELGVGAGLGLRLAWNYLILRLDLATRVYDPTQQLGFFPHGLNHPMLHFGIGHTF